MAWSYRRPITVNNSNNLNNLTNYQVKISLDSTNFDFSKANSGGSDIRMTDSNGLTLIDFWIEKWDSTAQTATVWTEVPSIPGSSTKNIYMYYGNPDATSVSDEVATFDLIDHDWDLTNYTIGGGHFTWSQETLGIYGNTVKAYNNTTGEDYCVRNGFTITDAVVSILIKTPNVTTNDQPALNARWTDESNRIQVRLASNTNDIRLIETVSGTPTILASTPFTLTTDLYKIEIYMAGNQVRTVVTNVTTGTQIWDSGFVTTNKTTGGQVGPRAISGVAGTIQYWDDLRVRKYTSPEPTTSVGAEETGYWLSPGVRASGSIILF